MSVQTVSSTAVAHALTALRANRPVSYTHLTLPTTPRV